MRREVEIIPYSTVRGYNLEGLFTAMLRACKEHRSWILSGLKNFSYRDSIPVELLRGGEKVALNSSAAEAPEPEEGSSGRDEGGHPVGLLSSLFSMFFGRQTTEKPPTAKELKDMETRILGEKRRRLSKSSSNPIN